jgi:hypothetical protein
LVGRFFLTNSSGHPAQNNRFNSSSREENAYLIFRLSKLIQKSLSAPAVEDDSGLDHFAYLAPVMRALLEKSRYLF